MNSTLLTAAASCVKIVWSVLNTDIDEGKILKTYNLQLWRQIWLFCTSAVSMWNIQKDIYQTLLIIIVIQMDVHVIESKR